MRKLLFLIFPLLCFSLSVYGQVAMGQWRTHYAYSSVTCVTQSENSVFATSSGALFSVGKSDNLVTTYDKISGLSDNVISQIEFDNVNNQLVIGYNNGNIDLLTGSGIVNIPDYYNKIMSIDKNINHITVYDNKAFLSCNFGILVLNLKKQEIAESYYIGNEAAEAAVVNTTICNGSIYALAYTGHDDDTRQYEIYTASLSSPNLVNYENWSALENLPGNGNIETLQVFNNSLFLLRDSVLYYQKTDNTWENFKNISAYNISSSNGRMIINIDNVQTAFVDENLNITYKTGIGSFSDAIYDNRNADYWLGGLSEGLIYYKYDNLENPIMNLYIPDGPRMNDCWNLTFSGEKLYVVPGGRWGAQESRTAYVMVFEDNKWNNIKPKIDMPAFDFMKATVDPADENHFFVTSYGTGLFEFRDNRQINWYSGFNTSELDAAGGNNPLYYTRLDGGVFDAAGNFWFTNTSAEYGVKVLTPQGKFIKISCNGINGHTTVGQIYINNKNTNHKWVLGVRVNPGIGILDDNGTVEYTADDKSRFHTSFLDSDVNKQGERISPSTYYCLAQEKSGTIWVGTNMGPLLFQNPEKAFDSDFAATRIKIPRNDGSGLADLLLENERVKAIAIDAANRKWLGTESSGVFLVSENGQETIHHFTTENSPLLSNDILSIAINSVSGEVFFATANGLVSYQADAADAGSAFENVHVYPNPVRENYEGMITIKGLLENTQVKITDLNGNLICETRSNGSIATWDGKNTFGKRVGTGVYLALCVSEDGKSSEIVKILVIN